MTEVANQIDLFIEYHEARVKAYKAMQELAKPWAVKYGNFEPDGYYDGLTINARDFNTNDIEPGIFINVWRYNERRDYAFKMKAAIKWSKDAGFEYTIEFNRKRIGMPAVLQYKNNDELIEAFEKFFAEDRKKILKDTKKKILKTINSLPD